MKVEIINGREQIKLRPDSDVLVRDTFVPEGHPDLSGLWVGNNFLVKDDVRELRKRLEQWEYSNTLRLPTDE